MKIILINFIINFIIIKSQLLDAHHKEIRKLTDIDLKQIRKDLLKQHNSYRKKHSAGSLKKNSQLEEIAQKYSEVLAKKGSLVHSGSKFNGEAMGENLYMSWGMTSVSGKHVTDEWYNEIELYDFKKPGFSEETGHFTQLVWKGTKEMGCGAACQGSTCAVTCNYYPAGNYMGEFEANVLPPKKGMSKAGAAFLAIFIIILVVLIGFGIYHFIIKKRNLSQIKSYFNKNNSSN